MLGSLYGGIAGIFLLGFFVRRANRQGLYTAMVVGILFTTYAVLTSTYVGEGDESRLLLDAGRFNFTHHKLMLGVYTHLIIIGVGWSASYLFPAQAPESHLVYLGWKKSQPG